MYTFVKHKKKTMLRNFLRKLELDKREAKISIDKEIEDNRRVAKEAKLQADIVIQSEKARVGEFLVNLEKICAKETGEFEHTFHSTKEKHLSELARLDALIEGKKMYLKSEDERFNLVIKNKNEEIARLNSYVEKLIEANKEIGKSNASIEVKNH